MIIISVLSVPFCHIYTMSVLLLYLYYVCLSIIPILSCLYIFFYHAYNLLSIHGYHNHTVRTWLSITCLVSLYVLLSGAALANCAPAQGRHEPRAAPTFSISILSMSSFLWYLYCLYIAFYHIYIYLSVSDGVFSAILRKCNVLMSKIYSSSLTEFIFLILTETTLDARQRWQENLFLLQLGHRFWQEYAFPEHVYFFMYIFLVLRHYMYR